MKQHKINYMDLDLVVYGTYYKGADGDYFTPPEPESFEIEKVLIEDKVDITEMLCNSYEFKTDDSLLDILEFKILNAKYR